MDTNPTPVSQLLAAPKPAAGEGGSTHPILNFPDCGLRTMDCEMWTTPDAPRLAPSMAVFHYSKIRNPNLKIPPNFLKVNTSENKQFQPKKFAFFYGQFLTNTEQIRKK